MDPVEQFISIGVSLAARTEYSDFVSVLPERRGFLPDAIVERNRDIFDDDQDFPFHERSLSRASDTGRPERTSSLPDPSAGWRSCSPAMANSGDSKSSRSDPACAGWSTALPSRPTSG